MEESKMEKAPVDPVAVAINLLEEARDKLRDDEFKAAYDFIALAREPNRQLMLYEEEARERIAKAERECADKVRNKDREAREAVARAQGHANNRILNFEREYLAKCKADEERKRAGIPNIAICCFLGILPIPFIQRGGFRCCYCSNCAAFRMISCCRNVGRKQGGRYRTDSIYLVCCPCGWCDYYDSPSDYDITSAVCYDCC